MKRFNYLFILISTIFCLSSCTEEDLIILDSIPMFKDDGSPRVLARPESVEANGDFNRVIRLVWPEVSPSVASADVVITKEGFSKSFNITDFKDDFKFTAEDVEEYTISITYNARNNDSKSKTKVLKVTPKDFEVDIIAKEASAVALSGKIKFSFKKYLMNDYTYTINYSYNGQNFEKIVNSQVDTLDDVVIEDLKDDTYVYNFSLKVKDNTLGFESNNESRSLSPLPLPYVIVDRMLGVVNWFNGALLSWSNIAREPVKVVVKYTLNGQTFMREKVSSSAQDTLRILELPNGANILTVNTENLTGDKSTPRSVSLNVNAIIEQFNTNALKAGAGWSVVVSSNHAGDGGGAPTLIDGQKNTYWHTPWNDNTKTFPHSATFTMPQEYKMTGFAMTNRAINNANTAGEIEFQISADGVNFTSVQTFTNTNKNNNATYGFTLAKPVVSKYYRLVFKTSLTDNYFMNLAEVDFSGYR